jgi:phage gp46-like protein
MILEAAAWLAGDGLVKEIECAAGIGGVDMVVRAVTVCQPDGENDLIRWLWSAVQAE